MTERNEIEERFTHKASLNLWNEEPTYSMWCEYARHALDDNQQENDPDNAARYQLEKELKTYYEENNPLAEYTMLYSDLMGYALALVDWGEIAQDFIDHILE